MKPNTSAVISKEIALHVAFAYPVAVSRCWRCGARRFSRLAPPAFAQYMGNNFHGDFGVNSGSQAGPGFYVAIPFAQWNVDDIKDADGNTVLRRPVPGLRRAGDVRRRSSW